MNFHGASHTQLRLQALTVPTLYSESSKAGPLPRHQPLSGHQMLFSSPIPCVPLRRQACDPVTVLSDFESCENKRKGRLSETRRACRTLAAAYPSLASAACPSHPVSSGALAYASFLPILRESRHSRGAWHPVTWRRLQDLSTCNTSNHSHSRQLTHSAQTRSDNATSVVLLCITSHYATAVFYCPDVHGWGR